MRIQPFLTHFCDEANHRTMATNNRITGVEKFQLKLKLKLRAFDDRKAQLLCFALDMGDNKIRVANDHRKVYRRQLVTTFGVIFH